MFYLAAATLASRTGGVLEPSIVTQSHVAGVATGMQGDKRKASVMLLVIPVRGAASSHFKKKCANVARPGMLLSHYDCFI